jgi:methionine synthase II (cobalamin-independent)
LKENISFNFLATGVGSVPFLNVDGTCRDILKNFPNIPFWPQFVKKNLLEDMSIQASEGLPLIKINTEKKSIYIKPSNDSHSELTYFYEHFMSEDIGYFAFSPEYAAGIFKLLDLIDNKADNSGSFIKGQIVGPVTFAGSLIDKTGKTALYNTEIMDVIVKGLAIKALWAVKKMSTAKRKTIIFIDEPYLSGFGSAFTPIQRGDVVAFIREIIDYLRSRTDTLTGIHCCGNTDWSMIIETGIDIVNFDAFDYMDYFLLYKKEILKFLDNGGTIAWGIVPTTSYTGKETVVDLKKRLEKGLDRLHDWGISRNTISERSILTPACGVGTLKPDIAQRVLELLSSLSSVMSNSLI